ncbi:CAP domain-containing protein [Tamlana sp. I1]|uniref:CAP domain-containing protein n=1 Tax=Tamlana sp. I1 TaxID=2762061 RepID=UPI001E2DE258|nr:CAP domain-containing protein [Tamlana sp. I1]
MALLVSFLLFSCSTDSIENESDAIEINIVPTETKVIEIEVLDLINAHRASLGLNTLEVMDLIKSVAYTHTDYMVGNNVVSHDHFFTRSNYLKSYAGAQKVSENVAYGFSTAEGVVNAWLNSEGHKANLEGDFTNFDLSAEKNDQGRWFFTNIFIKK